MIKKAEEFQIIGPIGSIVLLVVQKSVTILHLQGFLLTKIEENCMGWLFLQYGDHLAALVPAVLKPAVSLLLKAIVYSYLFLS